MTVKNQVGAGRLTVVGTPIGNLGDLSFRAIETLQRVDAVVCEDTRRTGRLLAHIANQHSASAGSRPDLIVANEHTEQAASDEVVERLGSGQHLALVTDAGMPTISDPGQLIVSASTEAGYVVDVVPGPTAVSAALAVGGVAAERYVFEGFLPRKGQDRTTRIAELVGERRAIVLYEAPHRLNRTLSDLAEALGSDRRVVVARELTKLYEQVLRSSLGEAQQYFDETDPRGEFVLVIEADSTVKSEASDSELTAMLDEQRSEGLSTRDAVASVVAATGAAKRRVYSLAHGGGPEMLNRNTESE